MPTSGFDIRLYTEAYAAGRSPPPLSRLSTQNDQPPLRHRYISLAHKRGDSWAEIGERVGQRSRLVTADRYSDALLD